MNCPTNLLNYVNKPDELTNFDSRMVATNLGTTIFYYKDKVAHRFHIDNIKTIARALGTKLTAFLVNDIGKIGKIIQTDTILEDFEQLTLNKFLNAQHFDGVENIEINWDGDQLVCVPDVLPEFLVYSSPYFLNKTYSNSTYLPHEFYNQLYHRYGALNELTLLFLFICQHSAATITIDGAVPYPLQILETAAVTKGFLKRLTNPREQLLSDNYNASHLFNPSLKPTINSDILTVSYKREPMGHKYVPLVVSCYVEDVSQWNELCYRLLKLEQLVDYDLIISFTDKRLKTLISYTFPTAVQLLIPNKGADIGAFFQTLNYLYSSCKRYKYILKLHYLESFAWRQRALDFSIEEIEKHLNTLDANQKLKMMGVPVNKFDFLHINWILKYLNQFKIKNNLNPNSNRLTTNYNSQVCRSSTVYHHLTHRCYEKFVSSGVFLVSMHVFDNIINLIDCYGELSSKSVVELTDNYGKQAPELAWYRIFGIIGFSG